MTDTTLTAPAAPGRLTIRFALLLDAVVSGANGVAYLVAAEPIADLLGVPADFLRALGAFFVVYATAVWLVSRRPSSLAVAAVVGGNLLWVLASAVYLVAGWHDPATAGVVWTVLQAIVVAGFAELQVASAPWRAGRTS
jgi:hypothetical protein